MARKFCTLEEAAGRLSTTADALESMLAEGLLQEFREGDSRFLSATEVQALALKRHRGGGVATMPPPDVDLVDRTAEEDILAWRRERLKSAYSRQVGDDGASRPSAKASQRPRRPGLRSWRLSRRQGLWAGVLDDRPSAILAVFILAALFTGGLAAAAYLLLQKL